MVAPLLAAFREMYLPNISKGVEVALQLVLKIRVNVLLVALTNLWLFARSPMPNRSCESP